MTIRKSKRHDDPLEKPFMCSEYGFTLISGGYANSMVSTFEIEFGEDRCTVDLSLNRESITKSDFVNRAAVNAHAPRDIFLWNQKGRQHAQTKTFMHISLIMLLWAHRVMRTVQKE